MSGYQSPSTYFTQYDKVHGIKADIERHNEKEKYLRKLIEMSEEGPSKQTYQRILSHLLHSKALVVSQLGKRVP